MDRPSKSASAAKQSLIERAWKRTPEERILLALQLGERGKKLAKARG